MSLAIPFFKGLKWQSMATGLSALTQFILLAVLARNASAADMGIWAAALIYIRLIMPFIDFGISNAVIQKKTIAPGNLTGIYLLQWLAGLTLLVLTQGLGQWVSTSVLGIKEAFPIIALISWSLIIAPIGLIHVAGLRRKLLFDRWGRINCLAYLVELAVGLTLIYRGHSIWALAIAYLVRTSIIAFGALFFTAWGKTNFSYKKVSLSRSLLSFAFYDFMASWINQWSVQLDKILVGRYLGPAALGYYTLAWDLVITPLGKLAGVVNHVSFPIYSQVRDQNLRLGTMYHKITSLLWWITLPLIAILSLYSGEIVSTIYGMGWEPVSRLLPVLCIAVVFKIWNYQGTPLLLARGRADRVFQWNLIWLLALGSGVWYALAHGALLSTVIWVQIAAALIFTGCWHVMIWHETKFDYRPFWKAIAKGFLYLLPAVLGLYFFSIFGPSTFIFNLIAIILFLLIYCAMVWSFEKNTILEVKEKLMS